MNRLYVSGGMSFRADIDHNLPAFRKAASDLRAHGYLVVDPGEKGVLVDWTWSDYLAYDLVEMITKCNGVAILDGDDWLTSRGSQLEVHVARELGWPVHPVSWWIREALP